MQTIRQCRGRAINVVVCPVSVGVSLETRGVWSGSKDMEHIRPAARARVEGSKSVAHILLEAKDNPKCQRA